MHASERRGERPLVAVLGGGIAGLVAARALARGGMRVTLLEASDRLGGKVRTDELEGRPAEAGPDSFLAREPHAERLCVELGLESQLVAPATFGAHIWSSGGLRPLPEGSVLGVPPSPWAAFRSGLLSSRGALRTVGDFFLPGPLRGPDISVGALVRRRLGTEVLERLVDPILGGTRAGGSDEISLAAAAPALDAVARGRRSLFLGLRAARRSGAAAPPAFLGLRDGMEQLVHALRAELLSDVEVLLSQRVQRVERVGHRLRVVAEGAKEVDAVVIAVPAPAAAGMLRSLMPEAAELLASITYASVGIVHLVYPPAAGELPSTGSGMLVPTREGRLVAGCTWVARKWPHLAPVDGGSPIRCFVGRSGSLPALELADRDLVARIDAELRLALGLAKPPRAYHVVRWPNAIPQYRVGHLDRMQRVAEELARAPNVVLAGAGYRGSGLPDAIRQGEDAARAVLDKLQARL